MARKERTNHTREQKAHILRRHLVDKVPISDLCTEYGMHVATFYLWQKRMFEGALGGDGNATRSSREKELERKVAGLEARLAKKDAVIVEISQEYVALKKSLGEP
jgi:transposase